jgi:membrane-associated phospholipid phosphatase
LTAGYNAFINGLFLYQIFSYMKKILLLITSVWLIAIMVHAQSADAGNWKTWFVQSGKEYRLAPPVSSKQEVAQVLSSQRNMDSAALQQVLFWNAGSPGFRWEEMINKLWMTDTSGNGALANMLVATGIYDATVAAWDTKYAYQRQRPFVTDARVKVYAVKPGTPSYPCEYSVAAGVGATIIAHFFPSLADSVNHMAQRAMASRIAAGMAYPSDTGAGYELGKRIAEKEIEHTKDYTCKIPWDGKRPGDAGVWKGKPMLPQAGLGKTVVLDSSSQFRPGPPPDYTKDMAELKAFKPTFRSMANAFYWASQDFWFEALNKKIFEYNLNLDPPAAARLYAITAIGQYDAFTACWDAKYTYWGTRPDQYDTTFHPVLIYTPPFPGYPSGHAVLSGMQATLYSYFFPAEQSYFQKKAKDAAESRFQGGIHFRTDNEVGLELGRKVANAMIQKLKGDGVDHVVPLLQLKDNQRVVITR